MKIDFIVGVTNTGFDAYNEREGKIVAVTTGSNIEDLKANAFECYNLYQEHNGKKQITIDQINLIFDLPD